ncbi:uncharacterized protein LOC142978375 [Anticarsia gemmatalis]|uniref:uncharacterized protein LOC142978375 n=1 Tax=Anticarsia gemmatalis TaxID=129554 RepID=UPI003F7595E8
MDTEKFIECVKKCPVLYDTRHKKYKDFSQKSEVWERIALEMNEHSEILRTKWKGLKDGYTKYRKWKLHRQGNGKAYCNWRWGPYLEFLDPFVSQRKKKEYSRPVQDFNRPVGQESEFLHLEIPSQELKTQEGEESLQSECIIKFEPLQSTSPASTPSTSRPESRASFRESLVPIESVTDNNDKLISFVQTSQAKGIDAADLLFMSYADTFKKFSVGTQTKLKIKMATIFAEAELQEHNSIQSRLIL